MQLQDRQQDGQDDDGDDAAHQYDDYRLQHRKRCGGEAVKFALQIVGGAFQHRIEPPRAFAARRQIDKQGRKDARPAQRRRKAATAPDRLDNLTYPAASDGLQALLNPPASLAQPQRYRRGGYIKKLPDDPWGRAYLYNVPGRRGAFDISSLGADGQPGGENENADIFSSEL